MRDEKLLKIKNNDSTNANISGATGNIYSAFIICFGHCLNVIIYLILTATLKYRSWYHFIQGETEALP